jgi:hypothetical protein
VSARIIALVRRFLSDRSFTLIVEPALADFEFGASRRRATDYVAVARAIAGATWEDMTSDAGALTFIALTLLPATYYTFFFMLWMPAGFRVTTTTLLAVGAGVFMISLIPVAICYWPDKQWPDRREATRETS